MTSAVAESVVEQERDQLFAALAMVLFSDPGPKMEAGYKYARDLWHRLDKKAAIEDDTPTDAGLVEEIANEALYVTGCVLAFIGRDRGTARLDKTLSDLETIAKLADASIRTALSKAKDTRNV